MSLKSSREQIYLFWMDIQLWSENKVFMDWKNHECNLFLIFVFNIILWDVGRKS